MQRFATPRSGRHTPCALLLVTVLTLGGSACADGGTTEPATTRRGDGATQRTVTEQGWLGAMVASVARVIGTAMGEQPTVSPSIRILEPAAAGRTLRRDQPVTIRFAYRNFDFKPELRTPNAGTSLGSQSQVVVDGVVQGHVHGYLQRIPADGSIPEIESASFCVLERSVSRSGYDGIGEGECPGVPPGDYRLSVEFQSNSHVAVLKNGPRAAPTADMITVRVR